MAGKRSEIAAINHDAARIRSSKHVDTSQKRAFSSAGSADDGERLTLRYVKRDIPERGCLWARELIQ